MHLALALVMDHVTEYLYCYRIVQTSQVSRGFQSQIETLRRSIIKWHKYVHKRALQCVALYKTTGITVRQFLTPRDRIQLRVTDKTARSEEWSWSVEM